MQSELRWCAGLALLAWPAAALAHSPYPGIRGFYVGVLHPLTTPAHVLLIVAISVLLGTRVTDKRMRCLGVLFAATACGLLLAFLLAPLLPTQSLLLLLTTALGLMIVLPREMPAWLYPALTGASGFLLGLESIPEPGPVLDVFITTFGSLAGIHYLIMYGSRFAGTAWQRWQSPVSSIAVRVAGSWISAIGCLMLAFALAGIT
ncbi:MAG: HupE/UreJ family protein [Pseudohongiellaceae bacterium]